MNNLPPFHTQIVYSVLVISISIVTITGVFFVPSQAAQIIAFGTLIAVAIMNALTNYRTDQKVESVAKTAVETQAIATRTHDLVNGEHSRQLLQYAKAMERIAKLTNSADDVANYDRALRAFVDHQAALDKRGDYGPVA